jgi:succinyl-CoA synthetase beta subunit
MLTKEMTDILMAAKGEGWVLEPDAKHIFSLAGLDVPKYKWAKESEEALRFAEEIGFPVVVKIVSYKILHKSDVGGVVTMIENRQTLEAAFSRFSNVTGFSGVIVEEMVEGVELIVGAKVDHQFGPVILLGIGGTAAEIYRDTILRMAPIHQGDVEFMVRGLKAHRLLEGYRGSQPINLEGLIRLMILFSNLVMNIETHIESIDLNPVICSPERCVVADARIMLNALDPD